MSAVSDKMRHLCGNPRCTEGKGGKRKRVASRYSWCWQCRADRAVKAAVRRAELRGAYTDEDVQQGATAGSGSVRCLGGV